MATSAELQNDNTGTTNPLKDTLGNNQLVGKAKAFAKEHRWATATLAGVVGVALLNTLRGR
jgi:hypothetical protein